MSELEIYSLYETGEHKRVDCPSIDDVEALLKEDEVFLVLLPDVRRLYIWQGRSAPVTKKFVSSRVAQQLQKDHVRNAGMQHKIVAVDQGEETDEFIQHLNLKHVKTEAQRLEEKKRREEEEARKFEELMQQPDVVSEPENKDDNVVQASSHLARFMQKASQAPSYGPVTRQAPAAGFEGMSDKERQEILDRMLKEPVRVGYEREHLVLNNELYVNVKKVGKVFDEEISIESWDAFTGALKDGFKDIDARAIRLLVKDNKVKAIEIMKPRAPGPAQAAESSDESGTP